LGKWRTVLFASDVVRLSERLACERVVTLVDDSCFESDEPERVKHALVLAAVERARPESENPLFGAGFLPRWVDLGNYVVVTVGKACDGRFDVGQMPVGQL